MARGAWSASRAAVMARAKNPPPRIGDRNGLLTIAEIYKVVCGGRGIYHVRCTCAGILDDRYAAYCRETVAIGLRNFMSARPNIDKSCGCVGHVHRLYTMRNNRHRGPWPLGPGLASAAVAAREIITAWAANRRHAYPSVPIDGAEGFYCLERTSNLIADNCL